MVDPATDRVFYYDRQRRKSSWAAPAASGGGTDKLADGYPDDWEAKSDPAVRPAAVRNVARCAGFGAVRG